MQIIKNIFDLNKAIKNFHNFGFVPTMGGIHEGHISLIKKSQNRFVISCVDDHIFIKLPKREQHFWSPQLHLEITEKDENTCSLHGFFGPNPTVWTMFMFLHVAVGILFMVDLTWLYSNYNACCYIWVFTCSNHGIKK